MKKGIYLITAVFSAVLLAGCAVSSPKPEIIYSPSDTDYYPAPIVTNNNAVTEPAIGPLVPAAWIPPANIERKWEGIVIHHSATDNGNLEIFNRVHQEEHNWNGVAYDFVIGNGTDSGDGQIEVSYRWRQQLTGAHCRTPDNWANEKAVGICLVGNFNNEQPSYQQIKSLVRLLNFLQQRYNIPKSKITGHRDTPGANPTDCPGLAFPMSQIKAMLRY